MVANDKGVCIPAVLLFHRLETLTQINRQHGPAITISVSPFLPASLHSPHYCTHAPPSSFTSALILQLQSISPSHSPCLCALVLASSTPPLLLSSPPSLFSSRPLLFFLHSSPSLSTSQSLFFSPSLISQHCTHELNIPLHISPLTSPFSL